MSTTTLLPTAPTTAFASPDDTTAPAPPEWRGLARDGVRLLVGGPDGIEHAHFRDLPHHLRPSDLVVVNNSATLAGEVDATTREHGAVVVHLGTRLGGTPGGEEWVVELRTAPDAAGQVLDAEPGEVVRLSATASLTLLEPYPREHSSPTGVGNRLWRARHHGPRPLTAHLARHGRPIAYGYLDRGYPLSAYQTVFATRPGSAEMPSAARPFTSDLVTRLIARGVGVATITLHCGLSSQDVGEAPQPEWFEVGEATARLVDATRAAGGRVIAAGTTVTRALESAVSAGPAGGLDGRVRPVSGWTDRVISSVEPPQVVDGLITGWHNPEASHLLLVEAVAGAELTQRAYDAAVARGYLWHEFGDSALLLRR